MFSQRFVGEDLRVLASYLDAVIETFDEVSPLSARPGAATSRDAALAVLRRVRWHLAALPAALGKVEATDAGDAQIAADQKAFSAVPRASTFVKPRDAIDAAWLETILRSSVPAAASLRIEDVSPLPGGRSKLMAVVTQSGCGVLPTRFIFRQDWASAVTGTSVKVEYALMEKISRAGVLMPTPLHLTGDGPAGGAFMLMAFMQGAVVGDLFGPPTGEHLAIALAGQLARLHSLSADTFAEVPDVEVRDRSAPQLATRLARFTSTHKVFGFACPILAEALNRLAATIPYDAAPLAIVHGDLGFHNMLVEDNRLVALLDWEFAHLGHPAEDLGYIRMDIEKMTGWGAFLEAYRNAGGPVVPSASVNFYQLWGMVRLYCLLLHARAALRAGLLRDVAVARMCVEWMPHLIETVSGALRRTECGTAAPNNLGRTGS